MIRFIVYPCIHMSGYVHIYVKYLVSIANALSTSTNQQDTETVKVWRHSHPLHYTIKQACRLGTSKEHAHASLGSTTLSAWVQQARALRAGACTEAEERTRQLPRGMPPSLSTPLPPPGVADAPATCVPTIRSVQYTCTQPPRGYTQPEEQALAH